MIASWSQNYSSVKLKILQYSTLNYTFLEEVSLFYFGCKLWEKYSFRKSADVDLFR